MPGSSSSYEGIAPNPPSVVSIRHALFQESEEDGLSVAVPTTYSLYTAEVAPSTEGRNGDWYIFIDTDSLKIYRKVSGSWVLISTAGAAEGPPGPAGADGAPGADGADGTGSVNSVSVATANGVSGSVANPTTTPAITLTLGAITPTSVAASGNVTGLNLSGTNTGDQTNISGNAATVTTNANLTGHITSTGNAAVLGSFTVAQLNTALSDGDVATGGGTATGTNTGDQTTVSGNAGSATVLQTARTIDGVSFNGSTNITVVAPATHAASDKATPVDADEIPLSDSAASFVLKHLTWANLKATAKTYFDTLYQPLVAALTSLASGTIGANLAFAENTALILDAVLSADGKYCGIVEAGTAGDALAFGDIVYFQASDSRWELIDADAEATSGPVRVGIVVLAAAADGDPTTILTYGKIRADSKFPTLTIGAPAYLSTSPGLIQTSQPSGTDDVIRIAGYGITADELFWNPSNDYMTHV